MYFLNKTTAATVAMIESQSTPDEVSFWVGGSAHRNLTGLQIRIKFHYYTKLDVVCR